MKKAREEDIEELRKEIEIEIRITYVVIAIMIVGLLVLINC